MKLQQDLNQYINIYLHKAFIITFICPDLQYFKTSFICCFIVTAKKLIGPVFFYFSVYGDRVEEAYLFAALNTRNVFVMENKNCFSDFQYGFMYSQLTADLLLSRV